MRKELNTYFWIFVADVVSILAAWAATAWILLPNIAFSAWYGWSFLLLSISCWSITAFFSHLYTNRRSNKFSEEIVFITYHLLLFTLLMSAMLYLLQFTAFDIAFLVRFAFLLFFFATTFKYLLRKSFHAAHYRGKLYSKILLVGATPAAWNFYQTVNRFYYYGYRCAGFLDNNPAASMNGCPGMGAVAELRNVLTKAQIDEVVIALPNDAEKDIRHCLDICDEQRIPAKILPDHYQYTSPLLQMDNIGLLPVLNVKPLPLDQLGNRVLKRAFDIAFTLVFIATAGLILYPLIALLIKITSRGPILYKQERWGLNNVKIICYKFRTMYCGENETDANGRYAQATRNDPRVTPIGRILRKTNLDELPQFFNVLMGNMSVVGPRPHPTPLNIESMHKVENYMLRHIVLPGITGWAQVNGLRGETKTTSAMQNRIDFDLYYIHRWTFWLDCQIMLQTFINFLRGDQNAY